MRSETKGEKMKYTMNKNEFINEFKNIRADNFSYEALDALYDYLVHLEEDTGEEFEFDPVAWCCEYTEYDNLKDFQKQYGSKFKKLDDIRNEATVIDISNSDRLLVLNIQPAPQSRGAGINFSKKITLKMGVGGGYP
jgi:hypothetical protein